MKGIKYILLGIGILLFALCMYICGISLEFSLAVYIAWFSQIVGLLIVIIGFFEKNKVR